MAGSEPIEFAIVVDSPTGEERHVFRVPRKQRTDIARIAALAVRLTPDGHRTIDGQSVRDCLITFCAREVWVPGEGDEPGRWVEVDDAERFVSLLNSQRVNVDTQQLGEILMDLIEETGHPTGEPKP